MGHNPFHKTFPVSIQIVDKAGHVTIDSGLVLVDFDPPPGYDPGETPLFGDINGDCKVDILDIMQVASRWGTAPGDPDYNPAFDVNNDNKIDILDIMQVASHWGDVCGQVAAASAGLLPAQAAYVALDPASAQWPLDGGEYEVAVRVSDVSALGGYETALSFDPSLLEVVAVTQTDWLASSGRTVVPLGPKIDNAAGVVQFGAFGFGDQPGVDGNGVLAIVRFQPLAAGVSVLAFSETTLSNDQGQAIPISVTSGSVEITSEDTPLATKLYLPAILR